MGVQGSLPFGIILTAVVIAAIIDVRSFRIPNVLTLPLLLGGLIFHLATGGLAAFEGSVYGLLFGMGVTCVLYVLGVLGAGDVKLMAAVGAWLRMPSALFVFAVAGLVTSLYSFAVLAWRGHSCGGSLQRTVAATHILTLQLLTLGRHLAPSEQVESVVPRKDHRRLVPFAVMIAVGTIVMLVWTTWPWLSFGGR